MFVALAIICICFFILSFSFLFRKQLGKFFSAIFYFFKKPFNKKKTNKENRIKASTKQIVPKLIEGKENKRLDAPVKKDEKVFSQKDDEEKEIFSDRKFGISLQEFQKKEKLAKERVEIDEELKKISKALDLDELENGSNKLLDKKKDLPEFVLNRTSQDEKAILGKRRTKELTFFEKMQNTTEIEIDNEKIDLSKLPTNIKKMLITGILDRKDF